MILWKIMFETANKIGRNFAEFWGAWEVQKYACLVDFVESFPRNRIPIPTSINYLLAKSASIQPRTSLRKFLGNWGVPNSNQLTVSSFYLPIGSFHDSFSRWARFTLRRSRYLRWLALFERQVTLAADFGVEIFQFSFWFRQGPKDQHVGKISNYGCILIVSILLR